MPKRFLVCASVLALVLLASAAYAQYAAPAAKQTEPIVRTVLQKVDFPGEQFTTVTAIASIAPGALAARHTHPGVEIGYVLEGEGDLMVAGQPTRHVKAGDSFMNGNAVPHSFKNTNGDKPTRILSTYVVDKSKPLASAAPET